MFQTVENQKSSWGIPPDPPSGGSCLRSPFGPLKFNHLPAGMPPKNFGFLEAQIIYFQHFEEFSNNKLTLYINSDTITAISLSPKCNPVPIKQHGVMMW